MFTPAPDLNRPVPAAIDGRRWTVRDSSGGATNTRKAELMAPTGPGGTARLIRNHELIHAKITPRIDPSAAAKKHACTIEALQWAEDYRVSLVQRRFDLVDDDAFPADECSVLARGVAHDRRRIAGAILCMMPLHEQRDRLVHALVHECGLPSDYVTGIVSTLNELTSAAYLPFRGKRAGMRRRPTGFAKISAPLARSFDMEFPVSPQPGRKEEGENDPTIQRKLNAIRGAGRWGRLLDVFPLKMTRAVKPRRPVGRRFSDTGVIPSAVHRLPVDGSVFTTKRRAKGGTILCDNSGSMSYDDDDIERILKDAPASKIAFYAGGRRGGKEIGRIVIAADRGRAATVQEVSRAMPGGENFIDGPALRWLARQPAPRVWVSDEEVGGVNDFGIGGECHRECIAICRAANIRIVKSIDLLK